MTHPLAALLAGVPRYRLTGYDAGTQPDGAGDFVAYHEVLAALSAAPVGVRVQELQWAVYGGDGFFGNGLFNYVVLPGRNDAGWRWWSRYSSGTWYLGGEGEPPLTEEAAKAAAQADYEARIMAALTPAPADVSKAAQIARLENDKILSKAAYDGVSSLLLSVQQDCIAEHKRAEAAETALAAERAKVARLVEAGRRVGAAWQATYKGPTDDEAKRQQTFAIDKAMINLSAALSEAEARDD